MIKKLLPMLILGFILRGYQAQAQDPVFSQFYASPLQLNPAFSGSAMAPFIALNYRMQYPGFNNGAAYSTFAASYDQHIKGLNSGIGLSLMTDDAGQGILRKTYAGGHYSYKVDINRKISTRIGIEAGFIQSNLNWDKLIFPDQLDPINGPQNSDGSPRQSSEIRPLRTNNTLFDISTGFLVYGAGFHGGFVAKHLATPNEGFLNVNQNLTIGLPIRLTLHGGYEFILKKATRYSPANFIAPTVMFVKQGDFGQMMVGTYGGFGSIIVGAWYRHAKSNPESAILMMGFKQEYFKVGYSFDYTLGSLSGRTAGSHEISVTINLDPKGGKRMDINDCFQIFR